MDLKDSVIMRLTCNTFYLLCNEKKMTVILPNDNLTEIKDSDLQIKIHVVYIFCTF